MEAVQNLILVIVEAVVGFPVSGLSWLGWLLKVPGWRVRLNPMEHLLSFVSQGQKAPRYIAEHNLALYIDLFEGWAGQGTW